MSFLPPLEMRTSSIAPNPVESREAPPTVRTAQSGQNLNPVGTLRSKPLEEEEGTTHLGKSGPLPCGNLLKSDATLSDQLELTQI